MAGVATLVGRCIGCHLVVIGNPHKIPTIRITWLEGKAIPDEHGDSKEPLCRVCATRVNENRVKAGLEPCPIPEDAYDPIPESEL